MLILTEPFLLHIPSDITNPPPSSPSRKLVLRQQYTSNTRAPSFNHVDAALGVDLSSLCGVCPLFSYQRKTPTGREDALSTLRRMMMRAISITPSPVSQQHQHKTSAHPISAGRPPCLGNKRSESKTFGFICRAVPWPALASFRILISFGRRNFWSPSSWVASATEQQQLA